MSSKGIRLPRLTLSVLTVTHPAAGNGKTTVPSGRSFLDWGALSNSWTESTFLKVMILLQATLIHILQCFLQSLLLNFYRLRGYGHQLCPQCPHGQSTPLQKGSLRGEWVFFFYCLTLSAGTWEIHIYECMNIKAGLPSLEERLV